MEIPKGHVEILIDTWPVARLATAGPRGRPHVVPVVFARAAGRLWSAIDGKAKADGELARVTHIRRQREVSLLLDHYDSDWSRLWWIRVEAEAEIRAPADRADHGTTPEISAGVRALRRKYPQYRTTELLREPATLLCLQVTRTVSWCARPWPDHGGPKDGS